MAVMNKEDAKREIAKLVEKFERDYHKIKEYSEDDIRAIFIDPLFESLGWEKDDALRQKTVEKAGKPDYIFYLNNKEVFVGEAKKAGIILSEEHGRKAVSYAWHSKIKFAVLTNFEDTRVYFAGSNTKYIDKYLVFEPQSNEPLRINFKDYLEKFDLLWLVSKESFRQGLLEKCISKEQIKLSKPVDDTILNDLIEFRKEIASSIKKLNPEIQNKKEQIDESTQHLLCRLIFIRSLEDRKLEKENLLFDMARDAFRGSTEKRLFPLLSDLFKEMNGKYDSSLFEPHLLDKLSIDEQVLIKVIKGLYFGVNSEHEKYEFNYIPVSLLGSIYEQYLGIILRETEKRIKLDNGKSKRKSMGIYYTPEYIVNYIVKNTVGEYIQNKSIDEILGTKIVDPACGSGSFLISAFSEVCKNIEQKLKKGEKGTKIVFKSYNEKLNLGQKVEILKSCIFGVDLDEQAVELARLSLLLKLLESETESIKKMLLPSMKDNIKCGNSLIDDNKISDKSFKWEVGFKEVMASGGFDIVIGNPPYIRIHEFDEATKKAFAKYNSATGQYDIYVLFIEKSLDILKENGYLGFIVSNKFLIADYGLGLRKIILNKSKIKYLLDVSNLRVFKEASVYPIISIFQKSEDASKIQKNQIAILQNILEEEQITNPKFVYFNQSDFLRNKDLTINTTFNNSGLAKKIENNSIRLQEISKITRGFRPPKKDLIKNKLESGCFKYLIGKDLVGAYIIKWGGNIVKYEEKKIAESKPLSTFIQPKILIRDIGKKFNACYDEGYYLCLKTIYFIYQVKELNIKSLLALLNSKLMLYYFRSKFEVMHIQGGYLRFRKQFLEQLPIKLLSSLQEKKVIELVNRMLELQKKYHDEKISGNEKERLKQQIGNVDYEIDQEVYGLYGITAEEQKIIEESLK